MVHGFTPQVSQEETYVQQQWNFYVNKAKHILQEEEVRLKQKHCTEIAHFLNKSATVFVMGPCQRNKEAQCYYTFEGPISISPTRAKHVVTTHVTRAFSIHRRLLWTALARNRGLGVYSNLSRFFSIQVLPSHFNFGSVSFGSMDCCCCVAHKVFDEMPVWKLTTTRYHEIFSTMEKRDEDLKKAQMLDARARNISHNVRCTECGSQSIEDSQADVAILLRQVSGFTQSFQLDELNIVLLSSILMHVSFAADPWWDRSWKNWQRDLH